MRRPSAWSAAATVAALCAGLLLAASASTARGTDLRAGRRVRLTELLGERERRVADLARRVAELDDLVRSATSAAASRDGRVQQAEADAAALAGTVGLVAVQGPGVEVSLDDAPRAASRELPPGATPDDLVVHEQDVHAVINALWAGGAEAVTVMGDRIIGTSSVRCVGNTLLLHGAVYSPPFVVRAIGEPDELAAALDRDPGVGVFRDYVRDFGLGYDVARRGRVEMPAYAGPLNVRASTAGA